MSGERVSSLGDNCPASGVHMPGDTPVPPAPQAPVDLRVVALTPDRTHLVLEDSAGAQFRVPVDERLVAALRRSTPTDRARIGQLEIALESQLSPREIQARIRAGHSVEEVSLAAGISAERVERYAVRCRLASPARRRAGGHALFARCLESGALMAPSIRAQARPHFLRRYHSVLIRHTKARKKGQVSQGVCLITVSASMSAGSS